MKKFLITMSDKTFKLLRNRIHYLNDGEGLGDDVNYIKDVFIIDCGLMFNNLDLRDYVRVKEV